MFQSGNVDSTEKGEADLKKTLNNGDAVKKFQEMIINQGVDPNTAKALCAKGADMWKILPKSKFTTTIKSPKSGMDIFLFLYFWYGIFSFLYLRFLIFFMEQIVNTVNLTFLVISISAYQIAFISLP